MNRLSAFTTAAFSLVVVGQVFAADKFDQLHQRIGGNGSLAPRMNIVHEVMKHDAVRQRRWVMGHGETVYFLRV